MRSFTTNAMACCVLGAATAGLLGSACVEQEEEQLTPQDMETVKLHLLSTPPNPKLPVNADLDGKVVYLGIDVEPAEVEVNKDIKLTHYWKVVTPPGAGWRMFTHLNGPNLQGYINVDHGPVQNKYPVSQWKAGDVIRDEQVIRLPATWAHDSVEIYTGIWKGNQRLEVKSGAHDGKNRVRAATLKVKGKAPPEEKKIIAQGQGGAQDRWRSIGRSLGRRRCHGRLRQHHDRRTHGPAHRCQGRMGRQVPLLRVRQPG